MTTCLSTDALVAIGDALDWDVASGLAHLQSCEECRADLETLRLAREGLVATESVEPAVLRRISTAVTAAAAADKERAMTQRRWWRWGEAILAGVAALVVLRSSGIRIDSVGTAAIAFALGAILMTTGNALTQNASLGGNGAHA